MSDLKSLTKSNYNIDRLPSNEDLNTSALMRIADAIELMASNYTKLQNDLDYYKKGYFTRGDVMSQKDKAMSNLRGQITKLKNKLKNGK